ncbi:MAG: signal peptidase II [Eubacterium sp.]|nr:signal peptidase II [Eubacterium sp.]
MRCFPLFVILLVAIPVFIDQLTKYLSVQCLKDQQPFLLINGVLELQYIENRGAAFSMLQNRQFVFYILTGIFLVVVVLVLRRIPRTRKYKPLFAAILILTAGAVGNLIDRILHQYVVDFIYFSIIDFPVFNVADICVTLSVIALVILVLFHYKDNDLSFLKPGRSDKK